MAFLEFLPLVVFFATYKFKGLIVATAALVITSILFNLITFLLKGKISKISLISTVILVFFGSITYFSGNSLFIKIKPTILNLVFSVILFVGIVRGKGLIKHLFMGNFEAPEIVWLSLSKKWAAYFLIMAITNEIIWRNFSEEIWVKFKTFGFLPISIIFMLIQLPYLMKYAKNLEKK